MMLTPQVDYLAKATGAMTRGDYLSAVQFALRAVDAPREQPHVRCDAYMVLALTTLEMGLPEEALAYAVGAHLAARWAGDDGREEKAASLVALVVAQYPGVGTDAVNGQHH